MRQFGGMEQVEAAVGVDVQLDVGAHGLAHGRDAAHVLGDDFVERARFVAARERMVADRHLQALEALRHPQLGGGRELVALEEAEAEGGVHRHLGARAAEQAPQRLAERLGLDVPQRDVERGDGVAGIAGLAARREQPVELFPQTLGGHRVFADQRGAGHLAHGGSNDLFLGDGGHAVADEAGVGLDFGEAQGQRGLLVHADHVDGDGNVQRRGADANDLQGCLLWFARSLRAGRRRTIRFWRARGFAPREGSRALAVQSGRPRCSSTERAATVSSCCLRTHSRWRRSAQGASSFRQRSFSICSCGRMAA